MPKYLWKANLAPEGIRGMMKEAGTGRRAYIEGLVKSAGGTLESFNYAFGDDDIYVVAELPDDATAAALSLNISASGAISLSTVKLLTPEEFDQATKISIDYRPPGA